MNEVRVAFTQQQLWPAIGGGEIATLRIARQLVDLGVRVTVFTTDLLNVRNRTRVDLGDEELGLLRIIRQRGYPVGRRAVFAPALPWALLHGDFDLIHSHGFGYYHSEIGAMSSKAKRIPFVFSTHGFFPQTTQVHPVLSRSYTALSTVTVLRTASRILVDSQAEYNLYAPLCDPSKLEVLPHESLPSSVLSRIHAPNRFKELIRIDDPYFLCIGRITFSKGFQNVIPAARTLSNALGGRRVRIVFVGPDWGYLGTLKRLVANSGLDDMIVFAGELDEDLKLDAIAGSTAILVPSFYETYGIVITEAMALGVPVVATQFGGALPRLTHLMNGFLVDPTDPSEFAKGMNWALNLDKDARHAIAEYSRSIVRSGYTVESISAKLRDLYVSVIS